jgi:hypothetical protein
MVKLPPYGRVYGFKPDVTARPYQPSYGVGMGSRALID